VRVKSQDSGTFGFGNESVVGAEVKVRVEGLASGVD